MLCALAPFEYGTNAVLEVETELKEPGGYDLYLVLDAGELARDKDGRWPLTLPTRLQVLVSTNGQAALNEQVTTLHFTGSGKDRVAYGVAGFWAAGNTRVRCQVRDLSDGRVRAHASLKLKHTFPK